MSIDTNTHPREIVWGEQNFDVLLGLFDSYVVQEVLAQGGFNCDIVKLIESGTATNEDKIGIVVYAYLADLIADTLGDKVRKGLTVNELTTNFDILTGYEHINFWLAEQSVRYVLDESFRGSEPYWADIVKAVYLGKISGDNYEIDRYHAILSELISMELSVYDELQIQDITNVFANMIHWVEYEQDTKVSDEDKLLIESCHIKILNKLDDLMQSYDVSPTVDVILFLYNTTIKYLNFDLKLLEGKQTAKFHIRTVETITSYIDIEVEYDGKNSPKIGQLKEMAIEKLYELERCGEISFGDGKYNLTTEILSINNKRVS